MINWKYIEKVREENKDNPNYPKVYWLDYDKHILYVKVGDFEQKGMSVEEARQQFKDNDLFITELDYLLQKNSTISLNSECHVKIKNPTKMKENISVEKANEEIKTEILKIISELELEKSDDVKIQLKNCCLVQKYIVEHNNYNEDIMNEKVAYTPDDIVTLDLYNAVVLHSGVCSSNALMFKKILEQVGVKTEVIGLISNESNGMHASNIVELGGKYYFFDSTLESSIYHSCSKDGNIILCCAGLGKNEYCQYYTPKVVLPDNANDDVKPLPENISENRIPQELVNSFILETKNEKSI